MNLLTSSSDVPGTQQVPLSFLANRLRIEELGASSDSVEVIKEALLSYNIIDGSWEDLERYIAGEIGRLCTAKDSLRNASAKIASLQGLMARNLNGAFSPKEEEEFDHTEKEQRKRDVFLHRHPAADVSSAAFDIFSEEWEQNESTPSGRDKNRRKWMEAIRHRNFRQRLPDEPLLTDELSVMIRMRREREAVLREDFEDLSKRIGAATANDFTAYDKRIEQFEKVHAACRLLIAEQQKG